MINLILSQQIGFGCYDSKTKINAYNSFFSYLNITDTFQRDSLFQAEARRCLDIIQSLNNKEKALLFLTSYIQVRILLKQLCQQFHL